VIAGAYRQFIFFFSPDPVSGGLRRELIEPVLRPTPHQPCPLPAVRSCDYLLRLWEKRALVEHAALALVWTVLLGKK
jgi:hypothetical protein